MEDDHLMSRIYSREFALLQPHIGSVTSKWLKVVDTMMKGDVAARDKAGHLQKAVEAVLIEVKSFGFDITRNAYLHHSTELELKQCDAMQREVETDVTKVKDEIEGLKAQLQRARTARRQRSECEELARAANGLQPRRMAGLEIAALEGKLAAAAAEKRRSDAAVALRERQFLLLLQTLYELQSALSEGDGTSPLEEEDAEGQGEAAEGGEDPGEEAEGEADGGGEEGEGDKEDADEDDERASKRKRRGSDADD
ncbi:hypothetical protein JKP88DRAFT_261698 [Tribonema minus]|uniref:Uncharacterized protein n=1 Tax=Tribonema minus TaxID=303371 RepID=A0A835YSG9_9STRA|nr:hypothetical protein JKP88DRAFT_261698 [Tribonema minus]